MSPAFFGRRRAIACYRLFLAVYAALLEWYVALNGSHDTRGVPTRLTRVTTVTSRKDAHKRSFRMRLVRDVRNGTRRQDRGNKSEGMAGTQAELAARAAHACWTCRAGLLR